MAESPASAEAPASCCGSRRAFSIRMRWLGGLREAFERLFPLGRGTAGSLRFHAGRTVQEDENGVGRRRQDPADPTPGQGARDKKHERQNGQRPEQQDQPLLEPGVVGGAPVCRPQKLHRRPGARPMPQPVQQVNDHRQRNQRQGPQDLGLQKRHASWGVLCEIECRGSKLQAPSSKFQGSSKLQIPNARTESLRHPEFGFRAHEPFGTWDLELSPRSRCFVATSWSLELGIWSFMQSPWLWRVR